MDANIRSGLSQIVFVCFKDLRNFSFFIDFRKIVTFEKTIT